MMSSFHIIVPISQSIALATILLLAIRFFRHCIAQKSLDVIPGPARQSIWTGNLRQVFNTQGWDYHDHLAMTYGAVSKVHGILGDKQLYVFDPLALHYIIVKEQDIYQETDTFIESNSLVFGKGLLGTLGEQHRKQRKMLNPVFSISHLRQMHPVFSKIACQLREALVDKIRNGSEEVDMIKWISRTALEIIGQSGLGHSFDPLNGESEHPYTKIVKKLFPTLFSMIIVRNFLPWVVKIGGSSFRRFLVDISPWKTLHEARDMVDFMHETSLEIWHAKKRALQQGDSVFSKQVGHGKDIMSILLKANTDANDQDRLPESELIAQISTLIFAAVDTTSGALCRTLHLLAQYRDVQTKLYEEIVTAKKQHGGDLPYDILVSLPYLDAICRETLRMYPPVSHVSRTTRKDTVLPLSVPISGQNGKISEVLIPRNTKIIVGIRASNRNPAIWGPDAAEWKPERWLTPLPDSVAQAHIPGIYSHLMTFLGGSRACIGFKFSQLEMKVVLALLVETIDFALPSKEIIWDMNVLASPRIKERDGRTPEMPLHLKLRED